ncbi:hypothetical protein [Ligilactobacillus equi]|uniref:Uncharacterized protein n=1 Tax=Ligilactobacillus equi DSM 15833 = JCM 10991 TaxID=1423740 RepID=A0A0R1TG81_9LACO|nr:hypothetical protein [Ligilactobacillus equi]KRL78106.1 hypothetical protein FC36_GL001156 [Ligilactobacillus equi DSM 15833 = JCM 10991]
MKYNDFKKAVKALNLGFRESKDEITVISKKTTVPIVSISKKYSEDITTDDFETLLDTKDLFEIAMQLAYTPLDERENCERIAVKFAVDNGVDLTD